MPQFEEDFKGILSQLSSLGGLAEDAADRVKKLVERADKFVQDVGPKIGVEAKAYIGGDHNLVIGRWDKTPASANADGKWHIIYQIWRSDFDVDRIETTYAEFPEYCQSLPSAKLDFRMAALQVLPTLLGQYLEKAKEHLSNLAAVKERLDTLEIEIERHTAFQGLD